MDGYRKVARVVVLGLMAVAVLVVPAAARADEGMEPAERVQATGGGGAVGRSLVEPADIVRATAGGSISMPLEPADIALATSGGGRVAEPSLEPGVVAYATGGGGTIPHRFLEPGEIAAATASGGTVARLEPADVALATGGGGVASAGEERAVSSRSPAMPEWVGLLVALLGGVALGAAGTTFRHRRLAT